MRTLFIIPLVLMSLASLPSWGLTQDDLVLRAGLYYKKFTAIPFTGEVDEGLERGSYKNGKREDSWESYYINGQLQYKGNLKNGELEGSSESYFENGQLHSKVNFKNGKKEGAAKHYHDNGQLDQKGNYKNGKMEDFWEGYNSDGTVNDEYTEKKKNGLKVSD